MKVNTNNTNIDIVSYYKRKTALQICRTQYAKIICEDITGLKNSCMHQTKSKNTELRVCLHNNQISDGSSQEE
uniref:Uncharacterized protein n=1 Tax=Arundo donax TaxID=35708 RepID=A0A0A9BPU8_ARUDO